MKERGHNTAFYIETLVMILVFVVIILVLTKVFAIAKTDSTEAQRLTDSVSIAQNAAEVVQASESRDAAEYLLLPLRRSSCISSKITVFSPSLGKTSFQPRSSR